MNVGGLAMSKFDPVLGLETTAASLSLISA